MSQPPFYQAVAGGSKLGPFCVRGLYEYSFYVGLFNTRRPSTILPTPNDFTIYEAWFCPASKEREYHKHFQEMRCRGEWFALNEDDLDFIENDLFRYDRLNAVDGVSLAIEMLCKRNIELVASSAFYAQGVAMFFRLARRDTGDFFMGTKQISTTLPNDEYFH